MLKKLKTCAFICKVLLILTSSTDLKPNLTSSTRAYHVYGYEVETFDFVHHNGGDGDFDGDGDGDDDVGGDGDGDGDENINEETDGDYDEDGVKQIFGEILPKDVYILVNESLNITCVVCSLEPIEFIGIPSLDVMTSINEPRSSTNKKTSETTTTTNNNNNINNIKNNINNNNINNNNINNNNINNNNINNNNINSNNNNINNNNINNNNINNNNLSNNNNNNNINNNNNNNNNNIIIICKPLHHHIKQLTVHIDQAMMSMNGFHHCFARVKGGITTLIATMSVTVQYPPFLPSLMMTWSSSRRLILVYCMDKFMHSSTQCTLFDTQVFNYGSITTLNTSLVCRFLMTVSKNFKPQENINTYDDDDDDDDDVVVNDDDDDDDGKRHEDLSNGTTVLEMSCWNGMSHLFSPSSHSVNGSVHISPAQYKPIRQLEVVHNNNNNNDDDNNNNIINNNNQLTVSFHVSSNWDGHVVPTCYYIKVFSNALPYLTEITSSASYNTSSSSSSTSSSSSSNIMTIQLYLNHSNIINRICISAVFKTRTTDKLCTVNDEKDWKVVFKSKPYTICHERNINFKQTNLVIIAIIACLFLLIVIVAVTICIYRSKFSKEKCIPIQMPKSPSNISKLTNYDLVSAVEYEYTSILQHNATKSADKVEELIETKIQINVEHAIENLKNNGLVKIENNNVHVDGDKVEKIENVGEVNDEDVNDEVMETSSCHTSGNNYPYSQAHIENVPMVTTSADMPSEIIYEDADEECENHDDGGGCGDGGGVDDSNDDTDGGDLGETQAIFRCGLNDGGDEIINIGPDRELQKLLQPILQHQQH